MKESTKIIGMSMGAFIGLIVLVFVMGAVGLAYKSVFKPANENVERQVFEETQSFVHGKIQDLAKYKQEYNGLSNPNDQATFRAIINQQFAQFDKSKIQDDDLRNFLVQMRGF